LIPTLSLSAAAQFGLVDKTAASAPAVANAKRIRVPAVFARVMFSRPSIFFECFI
jgi:hypothetical protein